MYFIKDSIVKDFKVKDNKVLTTIVLGNYNVTNPTLSQFTSTGWEEYVPELQPTEPSVPVYEELVVEKIRERYNINDELAILRQRDTKPEEFAEYNTYCEMCKAEAREEVNHE